MKVLFVIGGLEIGGAQKSTISMLNAIDEDKYDIDLLVFNRRSLALKTEIKKNINILYIEGAGKYYFESLTNSIKHLLKEKKISLLLRRIINPFIIRIKHRTVYPEQIIWESVKRDIVSFAGYDLAIACCQGLPTYFVIDKVSAKKRVAWMRSDAALQIHNRDYTLKYYLEYDLVNAISTKAADSLRVKYPEILDKVSVFTNIIDANDVLYKKNLFVPSWPDDEYVKLCTVGRLCEAKGYHNAIEACKKLIDNNYKVRWYIIGEGAMRKELEKHISELGITENFILLGNQNNPFPFMDKCDIYVQTSLWEGYCRTLAEAIILQKPIVTTDFAGAREQIANGKNGIVCESNADELYMSISKLIDYPELQNLFIKELYRRETVEDGAYRFDRMVTLLFKEMEL